MSQAASPSTASPMAWRGSAACGRSHARPSTGTGTRLLSREPGGGQWGPVRITSLVALIWHLLEASSFPGEGYRKVWARLRYQGIRTSPRRVLRLMRAHGLLAPTRHGHPHGAKVRDGTIITERVDTMWGTNMTTTFTRQDGQVAIFIAVDHFSAECVGIHAATHGTRSEALEPIRQGVCAHFGTFEQDVAPG